MISILTVGAITGAAAISAYIGRKGWLAFHRAVGITPGKVTYIESTTIQSLEYARPKLVSLTLDEISLRYLPSDAISVLQRIDVKADKYKRWRDQLEQAGHELPYSEEEFVIAKLLKEHLPNMLTIYNNIQSNDTSKIEPFKKTSHAPETEAYTTLLELLRDIEARLDELLLYCETQQLQDLKIMKRYLDTR